ncbi:hypothetical protein H9Y04_12025 [Streptomyces sp. TRM66268-LWL]|uniref:Uncharacterized protein n=1 Tax=Streptomyces polyasparticus TaxID=2767826 RepID=A0ABR7SCT3_9ACTN|nr:hypothetical protein [Streptomyces polyasparticus]MBC9713296.1 hypothetical protein [Streptomyces polyasparticus]
MPKRLEVGRSGWRTSAKHNMLNKLVGEEAGAIKHVPRAPRRLVWYDLTAGDAKVPGGEDWHRNCSPGIFAYHAAQSTVPVEVRLYEINSETYRHLLFNLNRQLPRWGFAPEGTGCWRSPRATIQALNCSGADASVDRLLSTDAVFAVNDPNAITDWAMRRSFSQEISDLGVTFFRTLTTMGCNANGLKRGKDTRPARIECFNYVEAAKRTLPRQRDLCFAAILRDDAQWAYLIETSEKWRNRTTIAVQRAFRQHGRDASVTWSKLDGDGQFRGEMLRLFLTKAEREGIRGQEEAWLAATAAQRIMLLAKYEDTPVPPKPEQMSFWLGDEEEFTA